MSIVETVPGGSRLLPCPSWCQARHGEDVGVLDVTASHRCDVGDVRGREQCTAGPVLLGVCVEKFACLDGQGFGGEPPTVMIGERGPKDPPDSPRRFMVLLDPVEVESLAAHLLTAAALLREALS